MTTECQADFKTVARNNINNINFTVRPGSRQPTNEFSHNSVTS